MSSRWSMRLHDRPLLPPRGLVPVLTLLLLPTPAIAAVASDSSGALGMGFPGRVAAAAPVSSARAADVAVRAAERGAHFDGRAHVDAAAHRLGFDYRFNPPDDTKLWARVWFGERTENGCTREIVLQGTSRHTSSWSAHEADGETISVVADYSKNAAGIHMVRFQLDRPNLPDGCARAEWWEGSDTGPTKRLVKGTARRTFRLRWPPAVTPPRRLSLPWGETSLTTVIVRESDWAPSLLEGLSVSLDDQPPVVDADSEPILWDLWRDGPAQIELPITPIEPWGTRATLKVTTRASGTAPLWWIRLWIRHSPPTYWLGSLSGTRLWRPRTDPWNGNPEQPTMTFVDDEWVHLDADSNRYLSPACTTVSEEWNLGCHHYWYDADTGRLQIDGLQARVTDRGWSWQNRRWDTTYRVRTLQPGQTRHFHGTGDTLPCARTSRAGCSYFEPAEVWLTKDGHYRWTRGTRDERGHYMALANSRLQLDPGAPGGRTKTVPLGIFGRVVDGDWKLLRFRLGNTMTRPRSTGRTGQ